MGLYADHRTRMLLAMHSIRWLLAALVIFAAHAADRIRVNANMVVVNVSVTDSYGRPIAGLEREKFRVFEDRKEQPIAFFARDDSPLSLVMIFDSSGSMKRKIAKARRMAAQFCAELNPEDEMALVVVQEQSRLERKFTSDCGEIEADLLEMQATGRTALLDAIPLAIRTLKTARNRRRAILLISDGEENNSHVSRSGIRQLVCEADAPIYAAGLTEGPSDMDGDSGGEILSELIAASGGRYWDLDDRRLEEAAHHIASELHEQYVIGYRAPEGAAGRYRRISVKVNAPHVSISYRSGYFGPE